MFIRSMMNNEFECAHCNGIFRNTGHCPYCGNPRTSRIGYDSIGSNLQPFYIALKVKEPFVCGDCMLTDPEWAFGAILDELDPHGFFSDDAGPQDIDLQDVPE